MTDNGGNDFYYILKFNRSLSLVYFYKRTVPIKLIVLLWDYLEHTSYTHYYISGLNAAEGAVLTPKTPHPSP